MAAPVGHPGGRAASSAEAVNLAPEVLVVLFALGGAGLLCEAVVLQIRSGFALSAASLAVLVGGAALLFLLSALASGVGS